MLKKKTGPKATGPWINKDWLYEQYIILGKTMKQIAIENSCGETVIHKWIKRHEIKSFTRSERLKGKPKTEEHKEHLKQAILPNSRIGANNPNWRGGVTRWDKKLRSSKKYKQWKAAVLERDKHVCVKCGSTHSLHVHYIKPFARYPQYRFLLSNGITLCESCHAIEHNGRIYSQPKTIGSLVNKQG